ncbi:ATP-binding cassette domain-containing protein [Sinorhizobium fredii]|uniref:ATP-binding cassette domain-containing protein n=2 Tax=Rhizobium fredii TaxID=380 RepID=A0A844AHZ8_RHIFR|nr:ATP-binding cassette domain-containing protein [Sinorhizobium fredii]
MGIEKGIRMSQVRLEQVTKSFGSVTVIPPLDLSIADREFVVLVGPSGCGKTTTLRMIAGLESATSGTIRIGERTVAGNIGYGMKVRGTSKSDIEKSVAEAARILNLGAYLNRKPSALSGGQRQRVAIGRAIVRQPDVFLFDEPLSNLDAKLRIEMRTEIKLLHRRLQTTAVYVTHDQVEAMTMADRVVVMNQGRIEQAADPITLYEAPANLFVAAFIGAPSMNFIEGVLERGDAGLTFRAPGDVAFPLADEMARKLGAHIGEAVVLGIRPEHTIATDAGLPKIKLKVRDIEPLGPHTLVLGKVGSAAFTAQVHAASRISPDDVIEVPIDIGKVHFFLKATGEAVGR